MGMLERVAATVLLVAAFGIAPCAQSARRAAPADLVLVNGRILTVDAHDTIAEALAVRAGRIVAVGSNRAIRALAGHATTVIDLQGRAATPGLIDTHAHITEGGIAAVSDVDLGDAASIAEVVRRVTARAATLQPGEWVVGSGWDEGKLAERRYVEARDLDAAVPRNPVWLEHTTGHYGVANSAALALAGIDATTRDPPAGTIDRDAAGRPTGVLKESAKDAVTKLIPPPTAATRRAGILASLALMNREGMTAVKEPGLGPVDWDAYAALATEQRLTARICVLWRVGPTLADAQAMVARLAALPRPAVGATLTACGVKLFMDGSGGARTAWLHADWNRASREVDAGNRGYPSTDPEVYRQQVRLLHAAGIHVGTHAIGDRAIDWVVDTYAAVLAERPVAGLRHSIIHANIPTDHALAVMQRLQSEFDAGYPESQGPFTWWIGDNYAGNFGPERALRLNPFHTYLTRGIRWGGGSDYPVTPLPARYGLWSSVARETLLGTYGRQPFGTAEAVDAHAALKSYTIWAAHQLFIEADAGSLEPGKSADVAVWDRDPYAVPGSALKDMTCELTLFRGAVVWRAAASPVRISAPAASGT